MGELKCPNCRRDFVRRVSRAGIVERLLSLYCVHPFKCQICGERFRARRTGVHDAQLEDDRREYERIEMRFPMSFSSPEASGEGVMLNFSTAGCNFSTGGQLSPGAILSLKLHVAPEVVPITVDAALVRYVSIGTVGVEFLRCQDNERERLRLVVQGNLIGRAALSS